MDFPENFPKPSADPAISALMIAHVNLVRLFGMSLFLPKLPKPKEAASIIASHALHMTSATKLLDLGPVGIGLAEGIQAAAEELVRPNPEGPAKPPKAGAT